MKYIQRYIFVLSLVSLMVSCGLDEPFEPQEQGPVSRQVELIARPTNFIRTNVATKSTDPEIDAIENAVHTAYFLMYDNNGRLLRYENLTKDIKDGTVPSKTIMTDKGMTGVTVCYIANLAEEDVVNNMTATAEDNGITDLQKLQNAVMELDYKQAAKDGYIGIPGLDLDGRYSTPDVLCLPMMGVWQGDLTWASGQTAIEIQIKRLFAKIGFTINLSLDTPEASLALESVVVNNIPEKVRLFQQDKESDWVTALASNFTKGALPNGDITIQNGTKAEYFFYVPEYLLNPEVKKYQQEPWYLAKNQRYKPLLFGRKKPTFVEIVGVLSKPGQDIMLTYKIYLGGNEFDDFSLKRNYFYDNIITIFNTTEGDEDSEDMLGLDHRVNVQYGGFLVGFQRATLLDSHFEVRPLRVKFAKNFREEHKDTGGSITVEILNSDKAEDLNWIRLERPTKAQLNASDAPYCLSGNKYSHTKRKYFTTDLVTDILADNRSVTYDPFAPVDGYTGGDLDGNIPVWVYIDEYGANSTDDYSADAVRTATIRVIFTPNNGSEPIYQDFSVRQRAIYPIPATGWDGITRTFGIEYFEEYLHDYDSQDNYGAEGGEYFTSQDGIPWGFDGTEFSDTDRALYFSGSGSVISLESLANLATANMNLHYDFYLTRDRESDNDQIEVHDYSGYDFNQKIVAKGQISEIDRTLNQSAQSVIEYCFNKNKRNHEGKVLYSYVTPEYSTEEVTKVVKYYKKKRTFLSDYYKVTYSFRNITYYTDTYLSSSNLRWYAPAIDELEDIVVNGKNHEFFSEVFMDNLYWSSQPAYHRNYFQYILGAGDDKYTYGIYFSDNVGAARATKYDPSNIDKPFISSDIVTEETDEGEGFYQATTLYGFLTVDNYKYYPEPDGLFVYKLQGRMNGLSVSWSQVGEPIAVTSYKKMDGISNLKLPEGIQSRSSSHRVRCIYNPTPPSDQLIDRSTRVINETVSYDRKVEKSERWPFSDASNYETITDENQIPTTLTMQW